MEECKRARHLWFVQSATFTTRWGAKRRHPGQAFASHLIFPPQPRMLPFGHGRIENRDPGPAIRNFLLQAQYASTAEFHHRASASPVNTCRRLCPAVYGTKVHSLAHQTKQSPQTRAHSHLAKRIHREAGIQHPAIERRTHG